MNIARILLLLGLLASPAATQVCGDCNGDGVVNILDALTGAQHSAAIVQLTGVDFTNCNVTGLLEPDPGAMVDILDALTLAQSAAGLGSPLMCAVLNSPPTVTIRAPTMGTFRGTVTILLDADDPDLDPLDLLFEFSTDAGATFALASPAGTGTVSANPGMVGSPAIAETFHWDTVADGLAPASIVSVGFRVTADDGMQAASDQVGFDVDNRPTMIACPQVTAPPAAPLQCNCELQFPFANGIPCDVPEAGTQYYVSAMSGSDLGTGASPGSAWASLCHAMSTAPPGSTIRVAEGTYLTEDIRVSTDLVVKGGFDPTFTFWDPDLYPSVFHGRLTLDHPDCVWGGFKMITDTSTSGNVYWHNLNQGTFVRNYVQAIFRAPGSGSVYGLVIRTPVGGRIALRCNDIYFRNERSGGTYRAIRHYVFSGDSILDSNRICAERGVGVSGSAYTVAGYGPCSTSPASITMTNNLVENGVSSGYAMSIYGCGDSDLTLTLTNNTFLSRGRGIHGYGGSSGTNYLRWNLTNNVVFSGSGGSTGVDVATANPTRVEITSSENNLVFGFGNNAIQPTPIYAAGDDTSGTPTAATVFANPAMGDFHVLPGGAADGQGLNVFGLPGYGGVTLDLDQQARAMTGPWDRGAHGR